MSIRIILDNPPEFYTNLDVLSGQVLLTLDRPEHVGLIVVKLEGESRTALAIAPDRPGLGIASARDRTASGDTLHENHKILYRVGQVFPDESAPAAASPYILNQGQHRFPFQFKFPFNNSCGNAEAMARIGGLVTPGGIFGPGFRVMDGTKQLMYAHVTKTLPPSFTGFPGEAEIRYYLKVTIQRPGIFKENWRYQMGLKFLPIEPPRPPKTNQEAYARRPFTFQPRSPRPGPYPKKRSSFLGRYFASSAPGDGNGGPNLAPPANGWPNGPPSPTAAEIPPSIEMSARVPHPAILTCNRPIPLRLLAKKVVAAPAPVYLIAMQIDLVAKTTVRCHNLVNTEMNRWVVMSRQGLSVLVSRPEDPVGTEIVVPDAMWSHIHLPNTVMPSFITCNLSREYHLEIKLGLAWGNPSARGAPGPSLLGQRSRHNEPVELPQEMHLPLHISKIEVYSGLAPPPALVEAIRQGRARTSRLAKPAQPQQQQQQPVSPSQSSHPTQPPDLPPRPAQQQQQAQQQPGQDHPTYDDAPPTYEEAMAEEMTGPIIPPTTRPAYSGVTNENEPSTLPEKN
ncbi:hypothetical protein N658DRAFT_179116 [Parathielavia hyrcaniae]|uniref:Arrestin-like N-terminal domain-containing protein n=1 Tax=Parathielavia hyrcaniae TaxID=113614 RepID=A0AAN6Q6G6_9PEZI|nr:hypothetical protein N658DRAFT_179116 [Parathielavia hyrcaniae]